MSNSSKKTGFISSIRNVQHYFLQPPVAEPTSEPLTKHGELDVKSMLC